MRTYTIPILVLFFIAIPSILTGGVLYPKGWKVIPESKGDDHIRFLKDNDPATSFKIHNLKLKTNPDEILSEFRSSTRRNINKAMNEDVQISLSNSLEPFKEFLRLNWMTRKQHGLPPQPDRFFYSIFNHIIS